MTKRILLLTCLIGFCSAPWASAQVTLEVLTEPSTLLLSHADRGAVTSALKRDTKKILIGEADKQLLTDPQGVFWNDYIARKRFNEESCAPTDVPFRPLTSKVEIRGVKEGDTLNIHGMEWHVLETPGIRRTGVSYVSTVSTDHLHAFTDNLIYGDGKIAHLYDLQDNFPEAQIGPYHGFMARAPKLIASLEKIRALQPVILFPRVGKPIDNPEQAIDTLIQRLRAVYRNYLSTSALWWYFGEQRMNASAKAILGDDFEPATLDRMPEAKKYDNPDWLTGFGTTRLIRSETGNAFVMDAGSDGIANRIIEMHKNGDFTKVEGIFVTHYHHDHNPGVPKVAEIFSAPVYGVEPLADILERPGAYRMPCLENVPIPITRKKDGETMSWHEFELTFFDFPGQTLYHNALLVRKGTERPILFVGDSFTPTGMDDYCTWNRNFLKEGKGYLYCLEKIRSLEPAPLLVNAHVDPPFEFDDERLDYMERALRERMKLLADLLAVPEINFGLDHAWCRFDPFVTICEPGEAVVLKMVITNHFDTPSTFRIELELDESFPYKILPQELIVAPGAEQSFQWTLTPASEAADTVFLSAKVSGEGSLTGWCEAVITARKTDGK